LVSVQSHIDTPRLRYVLGFLSDYYGIPFRLNEAGNVRIVYGDHPSDGALQLLSSGLLAESGIKAFDPPFADHRAGFPVLFPDGGPIGFDLFSAVFFLLSRYEEWLPHSKDEYGRYAHTNSVAFRRGYLQRPLIHEWLSFLGESLFGKKRCPAFRFRPTYDIDMAWSYRHKGLLRNAGGLIRSFGSRSFGERLSVLAGIRKDPFDSFELMDALHEEHGLQPVYFIHSGMHRNRYDKNILLRVPAMQRLVGRLAARYEVGLHPSWQSGDDPSLLLREKKALQASAGKAVTASRQHYIRFSMPETFRQLLSAGISHDYSMGYGSINGFRASVAVPFYWYDLEREVQTGLQLHPFCFMDANAFYEQRQGVQQTATELAHYHEQVRIWGGDLITIWHNNFLGTGVQFTGWSSLYEAFLKEVTAGSPRG
jgi:hypothetical protein